MSETRSSVSDDRVSVALSNFGGAQSRGIGSVTPPSEAQTESERNASKRQAILNNPNTPQGIKAKWKQICSLSSRNNPKNSKKGEFTKILVKGLNNWSDAYWSATQTRAQLSDPRQGVAAQGEAQGLLVRQASRGSRGELQRL